MSGHPSCLACASPWSVPAAMAGDPYQQYPQAVFMSRPLPRPEGPRTAILLGAYEWNGFCHPPVSPVITALGFVSVSFLFVSVLFSDFRASFSVLCFLILYVFLSVSFCPCFGFGLFSCFYVPSCVMFLRFADWVLALRRLRGSC